MLGGIYYFAIFFLNSCSGISNKQAGNSMDVDSLFVSELTERQLGESGYRISIPADYFIEASKGEDFEVYYFQPADTTVQAHFSAGVYFGNFPHKFNPDNDSCTTETTASKILGKNAEWTLYNSNGKYLIQTIVGSGSGESWNKYVHAFGNADSIAELPKLFAIFRTIKKVRVND